MRKSEEMTDPKSCLRRAHTTEMVFVLLGRDVVAPATIRFWCEARVRAGKNTWDDEQIKEALACAETMESEARHG
ncbi:MAG TPA: hypothetical protein VHM90_16610 [Phycisphaerae bacterium]|nr:hypothetical protein [Phycisphaerae bacterium]